jgi:hypothetical protein
MTKGLPFLVFDRDLVTAPAPVETDMNKMKRKALALGLEIFDVPQNGSCMFAALAHQLGRRDEAELVRTEITTFMRNEPSMVMYATYITRCIYYNCN